MSSPQANQDNVAPADDRRSYASFAPCRDPDGNSRLLQEVTERLPGR